ncbi:MAG: TlpA family protein disulfide reductase [Polaribacter sp.]
MLKNLLSCSLILLSFVGCNKPKDLNTFFGGKIINPKTNFVVLYSMDKALDTLQLDKNNRFLGKYKDIKEGLYYFVHGIENQYIYLEENDSLMLRLNTWDFDESLVFAGKGAERNNILIDCFLEDEKDDKNFYKFNQLEPEQFKKKVDSILYLKDITYKEYFFNHPNETIGFNNVLEVALKYPIYARAERYQIVHTKYNKDKDFHSLEASFYNHRKLARINNDSLMYYPPYSRYIRNHLYNATYSLGHKPMANEYTSGFTVDLLKIIDGKINSKKSKNAFLRQTVIGHFYRKSSCDINKDAFDTYFELSSNKEDKSHIRNLLSDSESIHKDKKLVDFELYDLTKGKHHIQKVVKNKNSLLFFWNPEYISPAYISSRMNFLSKKFPDIYFIQIKIDGNSDDKIHKLDVKTQFYIDAKSEANNFLTSKMPRSIIIDKKGKVVNGFASVFSNKVYSQLKDLSKK